MLISIILWINGWRIFHQTVLFYRVPLLPLPRWRTWSTTSLPVSSMHVEQWPAVADWPCTSHGSPRHHKFQFTRYIWRLNSEAITNVMQFYRCVTNLPPTFWVSQVASGLWVDNGPNPAVSWKLIPRLFFFWGGGGITMTVVFIASC